MTNDELQAIVANAGGKRAFARLMNISERYVDMLLVGDRNMSRHMEELVRLKILPKP